MKSSNKTVVIAPEIRVLKIATCPTLSGKSKLTYHVGCNAQAEVQVRIAGNTGGGFFNDDWTSLEALQQQLVKGKPEEPITSHALYPIFRGRSTNTPAFLMAVLLKEGFVCAKDKKRSYDRLEPKVFMAEVKALIASKVSIAVPEVAVIAKSKVANGKALPADKPTDVTPATSATPTTPAMPDTPATSTKPATSPKSVIKGKQFTAGKKPMEKPIAKVAGKTKKK